MMPEWVYVISPFAKVGNQIIFQSNDSIRSPMIMNDDTEETRTLMKEVRFRLSHISLEPKNEPSVKDNVWISNKKFHFINVKEFSNLYPRFKCKQTITCLYRNMERIVLPVATDKFQTFWQYIKYFERFSVKVHSVVVCQTTVKDWKMSR